MKRHIDKIKDEHYERGYVYNTNYHIIGSLTPLCKAIFNISA